MSEPSSHIVKPDTKPGKNEIRVLRLIRDEMKITRADLIRKSGLSAPTITRTIEALLMKNLITADDLGSSKGGRPPQIIRFDARNNYVIGIDIDATFIRAALSDLDGEFLYEIHLPTQIDRGFEGVMRQVGELIQKLLHRAQGKRARVFGIGVAVCGIVNRHSGIVAYSPVFNWKNVDVKKALGAYTDLRIELNNVAHLIALGELHYGIGKKYRHLISINLGYGIGSGIIINGEPFYGADGYAGEFGHIVVDKNSGRMGREGISGTVEALASGYGIADIVVEMIQNKRASILEGPRRSEISSKLVMDAAIKGDSLALEVVDAAADYIGIGIDTLLKLFNSQAIVLSGDLALSGDFFLDKIRNKVESLKLPVVTGPVQILPSSFGEDAALMGAFSLILEKILLLKGH